MKRKTILVLMSILGFLGLMLSLYLVQHHYTQASETGFCDVSATISCSLVNGSSYAELFHIPIAFYGVFWFLVFLSTLFLIYKKKVFAKTFLFAWSLSGFFFVFYLIYAEWQIGALCPWCTLVHLDIFLLLPLSILLYRKKF